MDNTCIACDAIIPEGRDICPICEHSEPRVTVRCPNCGEALNVLGTSKYKTYDGYSIHTSYHCCSCGSDWDKTEHYIAGETKFVQKFWGQIN